VALTKPRPRSDMAKKSVVKPPAKVKTEPPEKVFRPTKKALLDPDKRKAAVTAMLINRVMQVNRAHPNDSAGLTDDIDNWTIGIPIPALVVQYQLQSNVFPLGRVYSVVGKEGTCKSSLAVEFARWFALAVGASWVFEAEAKFAAKLARSILRYEEHATQGIQQCSSQDDWQRNMQEQMKLYLKDVNGTEGRPGCGRTIPFLWILDSLSGRDSLETMERIEKKGSPTRAFAFEAQKNTQFLRKISADISDEPISLVIVNHLKEGTTERGFTERRKPGGAHLNFNTTVEWQMEKFGKSRIVGKETILDLTLKCYKNSLGATGRVIPVSMNWWHEPDPTNDGHARQVTFFDWHASLPRLIFRLAEEERMGKEALALTGLTKIHNNSCFSKLLGVGRTQAESFRDMGQRIVKNRELKAKLQEIFQIQTNTVFNGSVDYSVQRAAVKESLRRRLEQYAGSM